MNTSVVFGVVQCVSVSGGGLFTVKFFILEILTN